MKASRECDDLLYDFLLFAGSLDDFNREQLIGSALVIQRKRRSDFRLISQARVYPIACGDERGDVFGFLSFGALTVISAKCLVMTSSIFSALSLSRFR